jgi:hypothetical protein
MVNPPQFQFKPEPLNLNVSAAFLKGNDDGDFSTAIAGNSCKKETPLVIFHKIERLAFQQAQVCLSKPILTGSSAVGTFPTLFF